MANGAEKAAATKPPRLPLIPTNSPDDSLPHAAKQDFPGTSDGLSSPPQTPRTPRARHGGRGPFGNVTYASSGASRPQSAVSRKSASHGLGVASQAFFRPMSSQQLQAHRGARPLTGSSEDPRRLSVSTGPRASLESGDMDRSYRAAPLAPPSPEGSEATAREPQGHPFRSSSAADRDTVRSVADSSRPLHAPSQSRHEADRREMSTPKTPKSYQEILSGSRARHPPLPSEHRAANHARSSDDSNLGNSKAMSQPGTVLSRAKNYEYFTGNTCFCWGGRFQNARHRPVNLFTGLAIVAPMVLFYVFT